MRMPLIWKEQSILKRLKLQFQRTPSDSATNFKSENEHIEYVNAHLNIFTLVALQNRLDMFDYLISDIDKQDIVTFREMRGSRSGL